MPSFPSSAFDLLAQKYTCALSGSPSAAPDLGSGCAFGVHMAEHERQFFTVYPAPKNVVSKADFQRLMLKRAQVVALATTLDDSSPGASEGTAAVQPVADDQPEHSCPHQDARDLQHLDTQAEQRRGHLVQSRCEVWAAAPPHLSLALPHARASRTTPAVIESERRLHA